MIFLGENAPESFTIFFKSQLDLWHWRTLSPFLSAKKQDFTLFSPVLTAAINLFFIASVLLNRFLRENAQFSKWSIFRVPYFLSKLYSLVFWWISKPQMLPLALDRTLCHCALEQQVSNPSYASKMLCLLGAGFLTFMF